MTVVPISERKKNSSKMPSNVPFDVSSLNEADGVCESWIVVGIKDEGLADKTIADGKCEPEAYDTSLKSISQSDKSSIAGNGETKLASTDQQLHIDSQEGCIPKLMTESETLSEMSNLTLERKKIVDDELRAPDIPDVSLEDDTDGGLRKPDNVGNEDEGSFNARKIIHNNPEDCCVRPDQKGVENVQSDPFEYYSFKEIEHECDRVENTETNSDNTARNHITSEGECADMKEARSEEEMFLQRMCDCGTAYFFPHRRIKCAARLMVSGVKVTLERGIESGASQYKGFMREAGHDGEIEDVR